jgi:hypothetical protein
MWFCLLNLGYTCISNVVLPILEDLQPRVCPKRSAFFFTMAQSSSSISIQLFALIVALVDQCYVQINMYRVKQEKLL